MNKGTRWVIVDVETDGLSDPIHVVELAAQLMEGWNPVGEPFRMLLNHDVPIPEAVVAIHGYSQEYLRANGDDPLSVYDAFRSYAQNYPLTAHNLSFDWNRCLAPEWARLGIAQIGQRGFCCLLLARRLVWETKSYRLEALKECFQLTQNQSHRALHDVYALQELFQKVYNPRLKSAGLDAFDSLVAFTKRTPVAKCLDAIRNPAKENSPTQDFQDEWYYLDVAKNAHGPLSARKVSEKSNANSFFVWREGMVDWVINRDCSEFLTLCNSPAIDKPARTVDSSKTMPEFLGLCRGIFADKKITTSEVKFLNSWLEDFGCINEWPASEITQLMERILEDGVITKDEKEELKILIETITDGAAKPSAELLIQASVENASTVTPISVISPHFSVINLEQGTDKWLEWRQGGIGASDAPAIMGENPWKSAVELLREKQSNERGNEQNAAMARGTLLEPEAREKYMSRKCVKVFPACLQSTQYEWLRASVDGISIDGSAAVEIKCGESVYRKTAHSRSVPGYYYGQLQHILAVTGLTSIDFFCYLPGRPEILVVVKRDEEYIKNLIHAEFRFWQSMQQSSEPA